LPSTGKRASTAPPSSDELVSCRRLAASASSSRRVEPRCSTKSTASDHASCAAAAEVPSCSKPSWLLLPSRSGCHSWAGSRRRRRGPELPHGAAAERRRHRAVTAETWFPTSVGSDAVASTLGLWPTLKLPLHRARSPPHRRNLGEDPLSCPSEHQCTQRRPHAVLQRKKKIASMLYTCPSSNFENS
jgi:hypothetical protein